MQDYVGPSRFSPSEASARSSGQGFITHHDIKRFFKRYSTTIWTSTLFGIGLAAIYVITAVPLYTARTQIIIDPSMPQALRESSTDGIFSIDNAQVESQLEVFKSEKIAEAVINQLGLENDREFSVSRSLLPWRKSSPEGTAGAFVNKRATLARFQENLSVRRVGLSYAIDILFSSPSPDLAARIANATADAYVAEQINARAQAVRLSGQWLEERIDQLRRQMNKASLEVQEFRAKRDYRLAPADEGTTKLGTAERSEGVRQNTMEELESIAQTYRRIYQSYLMAYTESVQKQSYPVSNARVITAATPPLSKSHPRSKLVLAFGGFMGWLAGLGLAFFRQSTDRSVWSPLQIREELGVECLACIPCLPGHVHRPTTLHAARQIGSVDSLTTKLLETTSAARLFSAKFLPSWLAQRLSLDDIAVTEDTDAPDSDALDTVSAFPFSAFAVGLKKLKVAIALAGRSRQIRCMGITSALPGEGKTTIAANLASLFAMSGSRTLLVDGDLLNSSLSRSLAPGVNLGLLDAINDAAQLQACIIRPDNAGFDLLPVAEGWHTTYSDDLLGSDKARRLFGELQKEYEFIVVEMPPLTANLDALTLGSLLDGTLLLVKWGKTPMPVLSESAYLLRNARVEMLGVALNAVDTTMVSYGDLAVGYRSSAYSQ